MIGAPSAVELHWLLANQLIELADDRDDVYRLTRLGVMAMDSVARWHR